MDPATGTPSTAYPLIGQVVGGRYHIVSLIGEGGMGIVYKAEQRLGSAVRRVAVKTLHAELSRDPSITARFHREVGTVAQLEHPNTVRVYDFGSTDDGTLYIAMEFLDGKALNRVIETEGALEPRRVGNLIRQVAGSLDEAHRQGIVHRDLKPENVLLIERAGEKDVVKLVDFGIAARTESAEREKEQKLTQQGMVLGTPPYMSPEQFTGKALDLRSDVYSLGVMVYEMLTGQLPFQADTAWQWATHHMTSAPRSFDETPGGGRIPEALRRTVLKALAKEPSDRQGSAGQFYTEFVASLGNMTSVAPKAPPVSAGGKTEAMPQATPFGMAPTEGMLISPAAPAIASPPVGLPPAPPREQPSSNNKGLIYGLGGVGAVLLIAMGVVALSSRDDGDSTPIAVGPSTATPSAESSPEPAPVAEEPAVTPDEHGAEEPTTDRPDPPKPASSTKPASATKPATSKPAAAKPAATSPATTPAAATPAAKPPAATPTTPAPTTPAPSTPATTTPAPSTPAPTAPAAQPTPRPTPPPVVTPSAPSPAPSPGPPAGSNACTACALAAASKDIPAAGRAYAQCTDSAARARCTSRVSQTAPKLAENAAFRQQCDEARAIIAASLAMGVPEGRLARARAACK
jgi:eukaryotic-like serine/threonine-protein kinase